MATDRTAAAAAREAPADPASPAAERIDAKLAALGDWRAATLRRLRDWIHAAEPAVLETVKWGDVPVWERDGILCTGETYRAVVKLTFPHGAALPDPAGLFNASLDGRVRRAIDLREGETPDPDAFRALIRAAAAFNAGRTARGGSKTRTKAKADVGPRRPAARGT